MSYARTGPAVTVVAAGLVLAGCGSSAGSSGSPASSKPAAPATSPVSTSSGGAGSGSGASGSFPYPIAVGNTWVYANSVGGTVTDRMTAVAPVPGGQRVTMANTISLSSSTTRGTYIFHSDGSVTYPSSQLGSEARIVRGSLSWPSPSVIAAGRPARSVIEIALASGGRHFTEKAHITVQGRGTTSVTVPAGTYRATIVTMTMTTTVVGYPVSIEVKTWIAKGTGPVQDEAITSYAGTAHVTDVQKLVSFRKG